MDQNRIGRAYERGLELQLHNKDRQIKSLKNEIRGLKIDLGIYAKKITRMQLSNDEVKTLKRVLKYWKKKNND